MTINTKTIESNNHIFSNGLIDNHHNEKSKKELIQEITSLKEKILYLENLSNKKESRKQECILELKQLLVNTK